MPNVTRTDLRFFTNEPNETLYDRFVQTLRDAQYFDVLVGYFRTSGFRRLYASLEGVEKTRILVGLSVDARAYRTVERLRAEGRLDFESHGRTREVFSRALTAEMDGSEDTYEVEEAATKFVAFLESGRLELRAYPSRDLHAKVYISRFGPNDRDFGRVITGSSNFSENGLVAQREFNVELKDSPDVRFALKKFEALWAEGVDLSEAYVDTLRTQTWLSDRVTPFEVYLKFLYEYFKEDINVDEEADFNLPPGFMDLAYQRQAVVSAKKVLEAYGGVFLADVVGLGKTFISALLLQQLPGRKLIVCPPVLMNYWRETLNQFYVPGFEVVSLGKLREIRERGTDKYRVVLVDEAHRFRNELTQGYVDLHAICRGKQVILVSATPLNNKLEDILAQLKLFQPGKKSSVPGVPNLEHFFREQQRHLDGFDKSDPAYLDAVKETAARVRDKVLKHVMVRRTRTEVRRYFSEDLERQGLKFPKMGEPQRIVYRFDEETNEVFNRTVELLRAFSYARYTPLLYLQAALSDFEQQSQRNIGGFMKGLLVKRLESSFFAFKNTLRRFIGSYERFITMLAGGVVYISKDVDVFELLDAEDEAKLQQLVEEERAQRYDSSRFKPELQGALEQDLKLLKTMLGMWESVTRDPKLEGFIHDLQTNPLLKGRKLVIFSESKETAEYLADGLEPHFPSKVMRYASGGGSWNGEGYGVRAARDLIETNYDPRAETQKDDIQLLMTTDVLAEGINLHRSNVVVNYDLPWNPTRVLQRVGRVNRVGTAHNEVYVFNFFPTAEADAHLGLEENIKAKLQAFHNTLGEDAKYLSSDEEISTHELFGDRLYQKLSDKETYEGGAEIAGEDESELKYLQVIRGVRDDAPDVFEKIERLPKKARSGRDAPTTRAPESLVTFFRSGKLKRFALARPDEAHELTFLEAAKRFECTSETSKVSIPPSYYELLEANKRHLETLEAPSPMTAMRGGGPSNETFVLRAIKAREVRHFKGFTDDDERYLQLVREALQAGQIPKNTVKTLRTALKGNLEPLKLLGVLKKHLSEKVVTPVQETNEDTTPRDVILSLYTRGTDE